MYTASVASSGSAGPSPAGLRARLLALALLAVLPALALVGLTARQNRDELARQVELSSLRFARLASAEHERSIEGTRQLLTGLARIPEIQSGGSACRRLLADLLVRFPTYTGFGVARDDGAVVCVASQNSIPDDVASRAFFVGATSTHDFAIGDFQRPTGKQIPALEFGYPVLDRFGSAREVVFAALSLSSVSDVIARAGLPSGSSTIAIDGSGRVLAHAPDPQAFIGRRISGSPLARAVRASASGTANLAGPDHVRRVYGWTRLRGGGTVSVAVGVPSSTAFAAVNQTYWRTLLGLALVGLLAIVAAWVVGTVFVERPVTRSIELERLARRRLEVVDEMRSDFVSMVSHELRNPMATIRGFGQILHDQPERLSGVKRREAYEVIVRQVDRMASLVDNVLEVSRMESDSFSYAFMPYDLVELLDESAAEARLGWPSHPITLEADDVPSVSGDRERVKQVVLNLISNACRYSDEDAPVLVRATGAGDRVRVEVIDAGVGIAPEQQSMLFQRFARVRTPDTANVRGTGLGLYISRRIVEAHGGRIWVSSEPGRGSMFAFELPVSPPAPAPAVVSLPPAVPPANADGETD